MQLRDTAVDSPCATPSLTGLVVPLCFVVIFGTCVAHGTPEACCMSWIRHWSSWRRPAAANTVASSGGGSKSAPCSKVAAPPLDVIVVLMPDDTCQVACQRPKLEVELRAFQPRGGPGVCRRWRCRPRPGVALIHHILRRVVQVCVRHDCCEPTSGFGPPLTQQMRSKRKHNSPRSWSPAAVRAEVAPS
jgi:hypothetical protein